MKKSKLHPSLRIKEFNYLFDVSEPSMESNIGKLCKFKNPTCEVEHEVFRIAGIQKIYDGSFAYRVYSSGDTFGRPASPHKIVIF